MSQWHGGKGGKRRKSQVSISEEDLRWKFMRMPPGEEKEELRKVLEQLQHQRLKDEKAY